MVPGSLRGCLGEERISLGLGERWWESSVFWVLPDSGPAGLLCPCVSAGSGLGAHVSQHPSRAICKSGTSVKIECRPVGIQASTVFWYRQFPKESFVLMATSNPGSVVTWAKGFAQDKFPITHPNLTFASLMVTNTDSADSGFYFCGAETQCWVEVRDLGKKA